MPTDGSPESRTVSPMVITLDHFNEMRENFTKHYFLSGCDVNFGGQEIQVPWDSFCYASLSFMANTLMLPQTVGVRFVHCYDPQANVLYLRMQLCAMAAVTDVPGTFMLMDEKSTWYKLANGTMEPTDNTDLFDADYLNYFYYCDADQCSPATLDNLASDTNAGMYARTVVMPWLMELAQLYLENGLPADATLCIDAGSEFNENSKVKYAHGLVAYLRASDGTPMLDNEMGKMPFHCKAANAGTVCPPACGVYLVPTVSSTGGGN